MQRIKRRIKELERKSGIAKNYKIIYLKIWVPEVEKKLLKMEGVPVRGNFAYIPIPQLEE